MNIEIDTEVEVDETVYNICMKEYKGYFFGRIDEGQHYVKAPNRSSINILNLILQALANKEK